MSTNPLYRENSNRAIYVTGDITTEMLHALSPQIQSLRFSSRDPITIYINSNGGSPKTADAICDLAKAPTQDGERCRLITVVHSSSGSAATDLLIRGDYAMAYPNARIHYHGLQQVLEGQFSEDDLLGQSKQLSKSNERFAAKLASIIFPRVLRLVVYEFDEVEVADAEAIARKMGEFLRPAYSQIVASSAGVVGRIWEILAKLEFQKDDTDRKWEIGVLHQIINFEYADKEERHQQMPNLTDGGLELVVQDFQLFVDAFAGEHTAMLDRMVNRFGRLFLLPTEYEKFELIPETETQKREEFLIRVTLHRVRKVFYLVLTYCRKLQRGEYVFTADEAYALGLIDEVCGRRAAWRNHVENDTTTDAVPKVEPAKGSG